MQHAAGVIQPGDTVLLRAGNFAGAHFTTSGTAALPITVKSFPGETVEIDDDNPTTPDGINLEGASHFVVEDLHINGRTRAGIRAVLCENVVLRGNRLDGNGRWGIFTGFCDDLLIESNHTSNSGDEHGIYVSNSGDRPTIRGNRIWDNRANGIHMNGDVSQGGDGIISGAVVENNIIYGNGLGGGSGINMDGVQSSIVRNNLLFDNHASGISLYRIDGGAASTGNLVYNNTVIVADDGRWALNIKNSSTDNRVRNNIFYNYHSFRGSVSVTADSLAGFSSDRNVVMDRFTVDDGDTVLSLAEWRAQTGHDQGLTPVYTGSPVHRPERRFPSSGRKSCPRQRRDPDTGPDRPRGYTPTSGSGLRCRRLRGLRRHLHRRCRIRRYPSLDVGHTLAPPASTAATATTPRGAPGTLIASLPRTGVAIQIAAAAVLAVLAGARLRLLLPG